mmetsp:Transcript_36915/g.75670  ORF Transcript_36915/g.75670 Transcript_36915/m.75670 type:complete len:277 (+) Transcript_36915:568-1398(+)
MAVVHVEHRQQPHCAHDGDPGRVKMGHRVQEEAEDDAEEDRAALDQQHLVRDRVQLLEVGDISVEDGVLEGVFEPPAEVDVHEGRGQQHARGKVDEEGGEIKVLRQHVAHDDVGRVADHGGSASDVREDSLTDEECARVHVHKLAQLARHGGDKQDCRHVVQERREHGRHHAQQQQQLGLVATTELASKHTRPLEHARPHGDTNDKHHSPQKPKGTMVHPRDGLRERGDAVLHRERDHAQRRANHGRHRPVQHLGHDEAKDDGHDEAGDDDLARAG